VIDAIIWTLKTANAIARNKSGIQKLKKSAIAIFIP
jgi:hypothetical protein